MGALDEETKKDDHVINAIGSWGRWQATHISILASITIFSAIPSLIIKFMNAPVEYDCSRPYEVQGEGHFINREDWDNSTFGPSSLEEFRVHDQCQIWNGNEYPNASQPCTSWTYDNSKWHKTVIEDYNLVCDREHYKNDAQLAYFAGNMFGIFFAGYCSDRFGRKATLIPLVIIMALAGSLLPFMPTIHYFLALRFIHGFFKIGVFTLVFVWSMEVCGGKWKTYVGIGLEFPWVVGWLLLALIGFLLPNWHYLTWITSLPVFLYIFLYWTLPESPKWLLATNKIQEAEEVVRKAAKVNGRTLSDDWKLEKIGHEDDRSENIRGGNILDILRYRNMTIKALIFYFNWFANSFVYYGLTLNTGSLGGSYLLNFALNGFLEIPAYAISIFVVMKTGRKVPYIAMIGFAGIALLCTILIPMITAASWPIIALAMIGKLCITGSFGVIYVFSAETYPTVVRAVGVGSSSVFARVGGMVAPYVGSLDKVVHPTFPIGIFGLTAILASIMALFLPETKYGKLPDTLEEGEAKQISFRDGIIRK